MNILPVTNINNSTTFGNNFTKKVLEPRPAKKVIETNVKELVSAGAIVGGTFLSLSDRLKLKGINYCAVEDDTITIGAGYNNGFYKVKTAKPCLSETLAKEYVLAAVTSKGYLGGLNNYIEMVKELKRQDIIRNGLKIHTYEINTNISAPDTGNAASKLSKFTHKHIRANDLFFIENDAYYYDTLEKTAYGINTVTKNKVLDRNAVMVCKFILNDKNNPIGYDCSYWDVYTGRSLNKHYCEQQSPSVKLKEIAETNNIKECTEAFRFGNTSTKYSRKIKEGVPNVLKHLSERVGISYPKEEELQVVRFYDKNKNIQTRICYYDSTIGNSFVYNEDGKYMYQLEYIKDHEGNIISSNRL